MSLEENKKRVKEVIASIKKGETPVLMGIHFNDREIVDIYLALFLNNDDRSSNLTREMKVDYFESNVLTKRLNHV